MWRRGHSRQVYTYTLTPFQLVVWGITEVQNKHGRDGSPREWNQLEGLADVALLEEVWLQVWNCGCRTITE